MTPHDDAMPLADALAPAEPHATPPRPRGPMSLVVLAVLAVGYTLWAAQGLILPILLAMFLALVGNPLIRLLQRLRLPRFLAALLVLCGGLLTLLRALAPLLAGVQAGMQAASPDDGDTGTDAAP